MKRFLPVLAALLLAPPVFAQDAPEPPALAQATGRATVSQPASVMLIAVERLMEGETFAVLWPQTLGFRNDLSAALNDLGGFATLRMRVTVERTDPPALLAKGAVVLNFGPLLGQTDGEAALANAMDRVMATCRDAQAATGEVTYELADDSSLRQEAIRKATENAFLPADAVASALRSDLFNVDQVRVKSVEVNSGPAHDKISSDTVNAREVTCTAEVEVTYLLSDTR